MKQQLDAKNPYGLPSGVLSESQMDELNRTREAIVAKARREVDPEGIGFDALMQGSDDGSFFSTDDGEFGDWMHWAEQFTREISLVSQRVSMAVASAGFAIAGAMMVGNERTAGFGNASLVVAAVFAVWCATANLMGARRGR